MNIAAANKKSTVIREFWPDSWIAPGTRRHFGTIKAGLIGVAMSVSKLCDGGLSGQQARTAMADNLTDDHYSRPTGS